MAYMTGAQALAKSIIRNGVDTIFGIPGVQLYPFFDAVYHEKKSLITIHTRHEQGAAYMAFGYAQSTGRVGTFAVAPGPGLLNSSAALATAFGCGTPVLGVTGQIPSPFIGKAYGMLHEISDQMGCVRAITKWQARIDHPSDAPGVIQQAFVKLSSGRRQPVVIEMAPDVLAEEADVDISDSVGTYEDPEADEDLIEKAAKLLGKAENPGIFVGGGIYGAEEDLLELAETIQAPVIMSQNGLGALGWDHYLAQNMIGGAELWPRMDVCLAVGTRFQMPMMNWGKDDDIRMIRIDPDPKQSIESWKPDVHIVTTGKKALKPLINRISRHNLRRPSRKEELNGIKSRVDDRLKEQIGPQHEFAGTIRKILPKDGIACMDLTQVGYYARVGFPVYKPRTIIQPGYQGSLGFSFPAALGAKYGNPEKEVICIVGDGGFMFNVQELATAVLHKINVVIILFNDDAFGNIKRTQEKMYEGRCIGVDLKNPDFMKLADSFGILGFRADTPDELGNALEKALKAQEPVLIEVKYKKFPEWLKSMPYAKLR